MKKQKYGNDMDESYEDSPIGMAEEKQRELIEEDSAYGDKPMDDTELQGIVASEVEDAITYIDSDLSPLRAEATKYYRGDLFGNEEEGNSHGWGSTEAEAVADLIAKEEA